MSLLSKIRQLVKSGKYDEFRATVFYFLSNIFTKAFGFLTIPLYTNLLTTSEYGYLNTYNAWIGILSVICGISLSSAILSIDYQNKSDKVEFQSSILSLSLLSTILLTLTVVGVYVLLTGKIDAIVLLALIQGYATFVLNFILQEWVIENKYIKHSVISIAVTVIPIIITCIIIKKVFQSQRYLCIIIPKAFIIIIIMFIIIFYIFFRGKCFYRRNYWKQGLSYCVPIVFHSLSLTVMLQADRIMISYLFGYSESGIYSFVYNVTLVIGVLISALENTWKTWFFSSFNLVSYDEIHKKAHIYMFVAIGGIALFLFISPELIQLLANESYVKASYLVGPIAFAYTISFLYDFLVYVEYKYLATKFIARASVIASVVNIVLNFIFIPIYGAVGASITTVISYLIQFFLHLRTVKRLNNKLFPIKEFVPFIGMALIMMIMFLMMYRTILIRYIFIVLISGCMIFALNKYKQRLK